MSVDKVPKVSAMQFRSVMQPGTTTRVITASSQAANANANAGSHKGATNITASASVNTSNDQAVSIGVLGGVGAGGKVSPSYNFFSSPTNKSSTNHQISSKQ